MADILYYSNYCPHSKKILEFIKQSNLMDKMSFISLDRRQTRPDTGQLIILLENGQQRLLPPNVHHVPSLVEGKKFSVVFGDTEIIRYLNTVYNLSAPVLPTDIKNGSSGEPIGYIGGGGGTYTSYGTGTLSDSFHLVNADHNVVPIYTAPEDYRSNKVSSDVKVEVLESQRTDEIKKLDAGSMDELLKSMTASREADIKSIPLLR